VPVFQRMCQRAQPLRRDVLALYLAVRDPRVPTVMQENNPGFFSPGKLRFGAAFVLF
jgi:hypothetical protein